MHSCRMPKLWEIQLSDLQHEVRISDVDRKDSGEVR